MMRALCTMPDWDRKWNAANRVEQQGDPPVVPLLGQPQHTDRRES